MSDAIRPVLSRRLHGRIAYRDAQGGEVGREFFDLSSHDGGHLLRALCVLDDIALVRDVTLSMDRAWLPLDGYCRILREGRTQSALWFRVEDDGVRVDGTLHDIAQPQQRLALGKRLPYLGLHPLQGDALIVEQRGEDAPGVFKSVTTVTNSISPNGDENVGARLMRLDAAYLGREEVVVGAGRFAARRYALRWRADWPAADLWVREADNLFLLMRWAMIPTWYELAEWEETPALASACGSC